MKKIIIIMISIFIFDISIYAKTDIDIKKDIKKDIKVDIRIK